MSILSNKRVEDLTGQRFGYLIVLKFDYEKIEGKRKTYFWLCQCDCGQTKSFTRYEILRQEVASCGCQFKKTPIHNLLGMTFGRWKVIGTAPNKGRRRYFLCECECGTQRNVNVDGLTGGLSKSCGCLKAEQQSTRAKTHGAKSKSVNQSGLHAKTYSAWQGMINRCRYERLKCWKNYGGRGIKVCPQWEHSFEQFLADMGEKPSTSHSIERKFVDGDYTPDNCVWATRKEQSRNTRRTVLLTHNGKTQCVADWAIELGFSVSSLHDRLRLGWTVEEALTVPKNTRIADWRKLHSQGT
jgi:hypothetical protein